jgi:hypothetical protein
VVVVGLTLLLVPVTAPTLWLMYRDVAPVTLHARVDEPPAAMSVGVAAKETITGGLLRGGLVVPPESPELPPQPSTINIVNQIQATRGDTSLFQ